MNELEKEKESKERSNWRRKGKQQKAREMRSRGRNHKTRTQYTGMKKASLPIIARTIDDAPLLLAADADKRSVLASTAAATTVPASSASTGFTRR